MTTATAARAGASRSPLHVFWNNHGLSLDLDPRQSPKKDTAPWPVRRGGWVPPLAAMVGLTIFLRERGSPEAKPVDSPLCIRRTDRWV